MLIASVVNKLFYNVHAPDLLKFDQCYQVLVDHNLMYGSLEKQIISTAQGNKLKDLLEKL